MNHVGEADNNVTPVRALLAKVMSRIVGTKPHEVKIMSYFAVDHDGSVIRSSENGFAKFSTEINGNNVESRVWLAPNWHDGDAPDESKFWTLSFYHTAQSFYVSKEPSDQEVIEIVETIRKAIEAKSRMS